MLEHGTEYVLYGSIGDGQLNAADGGRGNLVGVVDKSDGIAAEDEVLRHEDVRVVQIAIVVERLHGGEAGLRLEGLQEDEVQTCLKTVDEDILDGQQTACLGLEVHDNLQAGGLVAAFTVVDVGQIDHRSHAACLCMAVDDIMVVIPCMLLNVVPVFVVEWQERLHVVSGIFLCKGLGSLLQTVVFTVQQTVGDGGVDDLPGPPALGGGLFEADVHVARWRNAVVGEGDSLAGCDGLKGDRLFFLAACTEQQDKGRGKE